MPITERAVVGALRRALPAGSIEIVTTDDATTAPVAVLPDGSRVALVLRWAGEGFPRDVVRALENEPLSAPVDGTVAEQHQVFCASSVSEGSRKVLEAIGASWVALDGSASLHIGTVWVERAPAADGQRTEEVGFRWSAARAEIAEAFVAVVATRSRTADDLVRVPEVETLATLSGRSLGSVSNALSGFDRNQWTGPGPEARSRVLLDGPGLLDSWSDWDRRQPRRWESFHTLSRDPASIERDLLTTFGADVIFTGASAAELVQPFLTGARAVTAYVDADLEEIRVRSEEARMLPADSGQVRLRIAPVPVERTTQVIRGTRIASAARVYADLLAGSEREREAAAVLRSSTLGPFA
ncbi:type IV toxin-antitoxin system AbiEi family antitoxin [Curtobacterium sp. MCPF17_002]|uniref:type IV toxin-antitoxin system AbiEi family antitoxin n=1 Tax=Curtobacterium sp. MCPF17_002 TaxID=2175645 RepID=UPI0015E8AFAF|nr:type IV toxin-antitoxin system AbiEi family antitoxin [Curtobacterium sp. MCPF17_002]WIB77886.1 type IV toxin-antitoxin system AbiEi family antitoxin [Curtobacterium sp. MCPF17_002]